MMQVHINDSVERLAHKTTGHIGGIHLDCPMLLNILAEKRVTLLLVAEPLIDKYHRLDAEDGKKKEHYKVFGYWMHLQ